MKIVTGIGESPHVTSKEFREIMEGTLGQGSYILALGDNMSFELVSNNLLRINSGAMAHHGNVSTVEVYDEVEISNGAQGVKRIDLIVNRYRKDVSTEIESNEWIVIQGTPATENPVMPEYTVGNMQDGDLIDDCPVFAIHLDGLNVTKVEQLLEIIPTISELRKEIEELEDKSTRETVLWSADDAIYTGTLELSDDLFKYKHLVFMEDNKVLFEIPVIQGMTEAHDASSNLATSYLNNIELTSLIVTNITATSLNVAASQAILSKNSIKPTEISKLYINKIIGIQ